MKDLKIRVDNDAESRKVQELFFELGYKWFSGGNQVQHLKQSCSSSFGYLVAWSSGCFTDVIQCGCGNEDAKEITLSELLDMVNPMKEYLFKYNDQYTLVELSKEDAGSNLEQYIEVPEGASVYARCNIFGDYKWIPKIIDGDWSVLWQRTTHPEELPFIDDEPLQSLNDQYAEIEKVRQSAWQKQEGGSHYKNLKIQPMQYALENKLDYAQANVVKYVTRHADKNGKEDLLKAIHNLELMIEFYYGDEK